MNLTTRTAAVSALLTAAVAAAGAAHAAPPAPAAPPSNWTSIDLAPGVHYDDNAAAGIAAIDTPIGSVAVQPGQVNIRDSAGTSLFGNPITVPDSAAAAAVPAGLHAAAGNQVNPVAAPAQPVSGDVMSDLGQAATAASRHMGPAMAVGALAGSVVGMGLGCPFGVATGGTLMSLATVGTMTVPAMAAGCLVGAVAGGGVGASVGGVAVAIPVGIAAGTQKFNQLQAQHAQENTAPAAG